MARLIDADALIAWIDMGHLRNPLESCYSERDLVDMLESRPAVDAVPVRWIPVSERLPGERKGEPYYEDDFFLVAFTGVICCMDCDGFMMTADYCGDGEWRDAITGRDISDGVTHWMPLPDPPDGGAC